MKTLSTLSKLVLASVLLFAASSCSTSNDKEVAPAASGDDLSGTITISGAFALYPLAVKWGDEFKKLHPNVKFDISAGGAGKGISDALGGLVDIGAVSRDLKDEEVANGAFPFAVAKDAVVATFNSKNPNASEILTKGLSGTALGNIFATGSFTNWKQAGFTQSAPVNVYTRSDAAGAGEVWAKYFGKKQEDLLGTGVFGDPGLVSAVQNDVDGIGYNNISYAYDPNTKKQLANISVVPIDINNNGTIDADENFYGTLDQLLTAIGNDKYPSPPARQLYFITKNKPTNKVVIAFLQWVLTDGQKYVSENGYVQLPQAKLDEGKNKLN